MPNIPTNGQFHSIQSDKRNYEIAVETGMVICAIELMFHKRWNELNETLLPIEWIHPIEINAANILLIKPIKNHIFNSTCELIDSTYLSDEFRM